MNPESFNPFDRRGARAVGLAARPPAGFSLRSGLQKSLEQKQPNKKQKNHLHEFLYKTRASGM
jgi:hypothetical protein